MNLGQIAMAMGALLLAAQPALAFHEQGVAKCDGCHTMHNSEGGDPEAPTTTVYLLTHETASDVCLSCHENNYGAVFGVDPMNPPPEMGGGNFVFLLENNINDAPNGANYPLDGDAAGHNVIAPSRGIGPDGNHNSGPGGGYPASEMSCTSCHDPHGNQNFRMLRGVGEAGGGDWHFIYPAPQAVGIDLSSGGESRSNHSAYLSGMSEWCANCHRSFLNDHGHGAFEHPTEHDFDSEQRDRYSHYEGDADPAGGSPETAYLPEVPFEDPSNQIGSTYGPNSNSRILCLTCHRAHASSAPAAGRWDFRVEYLSDDGLASGSHPIPDPYGHPDQRHLCHKCHAPGDDHEEVLSHKPGRNPSIPGEARRR